MKKIFKDWKMWVVLGSGILCFVISLSEKDWVEAMWCFLATALCLVGSLQNIVVQAASEYIKKQDDLLMKADIIIKDQTKLIKELNDKLDGQDSKDSADSGPREVSEESL